jgi:hypothetical protein
MIRRSVLAALLAGMLAMLSVGTAFAHECVISSRSDRGDQGALNSRVWDKLTLEFILSVILAQPADVVEEALELRESFGLPEYWVTNAHTTIGGNSRNPNLADGRGLDHLSQLEIERIVGLILEAGGTPPAP